MIAALLYNLLYSTANIDRMLPAIGREQYWDGRTELEFLKSLWGLGTEEE
jgi:hypothetical protein